MQTIGPFAIKRTIPAGQFPPLEGMIELGLAVVYTRLGRSSDGRYPLHAFQALAKPLDDLPDIRHSLLSLLEPVRDLPLASRIHDAVQASCPASTHPTETT